MCMQKTAWERCVEFHGHSCPGLAIGYSVAQAAIEKLKISFSTDEEVVCVTENDSCSVDAVQVLISCTFGKGNLLYRDTGKQAFSFFNRKTGEKARIVFKSGFDKTNLDRSAFQEYILKAPIDEIFDIKTPAFDLPEQARLFKTIICESCGEGASENKIRLHEGRKICLDCYSGYSRGWCDCSVRL